GKFARLCKRNPSTALSLAGVVGTFVAAYVLVTMSYWRSEKARAEEARQRAEAQQREKAERWERYRANLVASARAFRMYDVGSARRPLEAAPEEHRNWEWRYFHSQLDLARDVLDVAPDGARDGRISANGRRAALFSESGVHVWDTVERKEVLAVPGPLNTTYVRLSTVGRTLATLAADNTVVLPDVHS